MPAGLSCVPPDVFAAGLGLGAELADTLAVVFEGVVVAAGAVVVGVVWNGNKFIRICFKPTSLITGILQYLLIILYFTILPQEMAR